jgi:hypothetical protein
MKRNVIKFICEICVAALCLSYVPCMRANGVDVGHLVSDAAVAVQKATRTIPAKVVAIAGLCVVGCMAAKALWTRYVTLRSIDNAINPEPLLYTDQRLHPISNWMMGIAGFSTPAHIRAHYQDVKAALVTACLSGQVDIFKLLLCFK